MLLEKLDGTAQRLHIPFLKNIDRNKGGLVTFFKKLIYSIYVHILETR